MLKNEADDKTKKVHLSSLSLIVIAIDLWYHQPIFNGSLFSTTVLSDGYRKLKETRSHVHMAAPS